jgi:hypothetical protein
MWTTEEDLRSKVSMALLKSIHYASIDGMPRPGWYRGNHLPPSRALEDLARVYAENRKLRSSRTFRDFSEAWPYIRTKVESKTAKESHLEVKLLGMSMEYAWSFVQSMMLQRLKDGTSE